MELQKVKQAIVMLQDYVKLKDRLIDVTDKIKYNNGDVKSLFLEYLDCATKMAELNLKILELKL